MVSSRAPVWGASWMYQSIFTGWMFQVVPPCGGHRGLFGRCVGCFLVSSRAPVWGASAESPFLRQIHGRFKSCPRVGGIN